MLRQYGLEVSGLLDKRFYGITASKFLGLRANSLFRMIMTILLMMMLLVTLLLVVMMMVVVRMMII